MGSSFVVENSCGFVSPDPADATAMPPRSTRVVPGNLREARVERLPRCTTRRRPSRLFWRSPDGSASEDVDGPCARSILASRYHSRTPARAWEEWRGRSRSADVELSCALLRDVLKLFTRQTTLDRRRVSKQTSGVFLREAERSPTPPDPPSRRAAAPPPPRRARRTRATSPQRARDFQTPRRRRRHRRDP